MSCNLREVLEIIFDLEEEWRAEKPKYRGDHTGLLFQEGKIAGAEHIFTQLLLRLTRSARPPHDPIALYKVQHIPEELRDPAEWVTSSPEDYPF